jgi:hypothetical protein
MHPLDALKDYWGLRSQLKDELRALVELARALPPFFRERITLERAEEEIRKAMESREERFLDLVRARIYERPGSPYRRLLKIAGCEFGDLQNQVRRYGLEVTLERLAGEGVYLTSEEFKGKKEVVRRGHSFRVTPRDFESADSTSGAVVQSSGTTSQPVRAALSPGRQTRLAFATAVFFSAHQLFASAHAICDAILPGGGGVNNLLIYAKLGIATDRWFARRIPSKGRLEAWYHYLVTYLVVLMGKWHGPGFPAPEFIDVGEMKRIVGWIVEQKGRGKNCCVKTTASNAVRISRAAWEMGASLEGTKFIVSGEPFTDAKQEMVGRVGATTTSRYSFTEGGIVGFGCGNPVVADEIHINQYMLTAVSRPTALDRDAAIRPLLFTTVQPLGVSSLLNVENGDYGILETRQCGCALQKLGLTLHLHHIRSYEKFTSEGMNYFYGDLYEFFEQSLPAEFGGGPGDYQLAEEEDDNGQTRLTLVVHPQVGEVNEGKLLLRLEERLAQGSSANRFQAKIWQDAGTLRVKRGVPHASARGKILPLHISR